MAENTGHQARTLLQRLTFMPMRNTTTPAASSWVHRPVRAMAPPPSRRLEPLPDAHWIALVSTCQGGSMRISELSQVSGVPVATIKYYLHEGLLPAGIPTSATSASYDERHVDRLNLIRALVDVGRVP